MKQKPMLVSAEPTKQGGILTFQELGRGKGIKLREMVALDHLKPEHLAQHRAVSEASRGSISPVSAA